MVAELVPVHGTCVLCTIRDDVETEIVSELVERLDNRGAAELPNLSSLCLPHLAAVSGRLARPELLRPLLCQQALTLERTAEDMRRSTLKQSAARRHLETEEERTAAKRGLALLAGRRNVNYAVGRRMGRADGRSGCGAPTREPDAS